MSMEFTYESYKMLVSMLKEYHYFFSNYFDFNQYTKSVIMRHDCDNDLEKALHLSQVEYEMGITSTYFVLTTSNFYNIFSRKNKEILRTICSYGHSVGLHFDEVQYDKGEKNWWIEAMEQEIARLEQCIERPVSCVSMHRPSKETLQADWNIRNGSVVNSYGREFLENHKYLSDSRRNWKENIVDIIQGQKSNRLHVLTHPIWYNESIKSAKETLYCFCRRQMYQSYEELDRNIYRLSELLEKSEVFGQEGKDGENDS